MRLGCLAVLIAGAAALWFWRAPLARLFGRREPLPRVAETVGAPSPAGVESLERKLASLGPAGGPDSVVLTPNEVASWIGGGIDWSVRRAFDSLRVELRADTLVVHARLDTRAVPPDALGPFAGMVEPREPLRIAGPVTLAGPGRARFTVASFALRDMSFPPVAVREIARRVAGADRTGSFEVPVPTAVEAIAVRPAALVLHRSGEP